MMTNPSRTVATVLFTDIVGSTERAAALGDSEWGRVLEAHHALIRREIRRFRGREANTAGDGFLATFAQPAAAIRCAWEIAAGVKELGVQVRSGVHTGEVEGSGRDLKGLGVHIGSRVASLAGPGEVLVTRTARELVTGAGFEFEDRGEHQLKGVPEEWRLYRVSGLPAAQPTARSPWPAFTARQAKATSLVAVIVAVAVLGVLVSRRAREAPAPILTAAPGIAILPFRVGPGLDEWREGMVDLLSTNLDGVGGLRAIDSRTVLARWREGSPEGIEPDLNAVLAIATRTGASYAVVGTAVQVGSELRLAGDVYNLAEGVQLGRVQVAGPPDSVAMLVDGLSIEILRQIVSKGAEDLHSVPRLASVTTASLPALRYFLEGEALYRRGAFTDAAAAYERAVKSDSSFGLAYYRLSEACGFGDCPVNKIPDSMLRAFELSDRMPAREAMLVRAANYSWSGHDPYRAIELLQDVVSRYPDDPEGWYILGETYVHYGGQMVAENGGNWEDVMARAVQLDPSFSVFMEHLLEDAFFEADSARAVNWGTQFLSALGKPESFTNAPPFVVAFGDSASRRVALATSDTFDAVVLGGWGPLLRHPRFLSAQEEVYRRALSDPVAPARLGVLASENLFRQGKVLAARDVRIDTTRMTVEFKREALFLLYKRHILLGDLAVSKADLEEALSHSASDTMTWFLAGAYAADRGRWADHSSAIGRLRQTAGMGRAAGDSVRGRLFDGAADALVGYGYWRRGKPEEAMALLESSRQKVVTLDYLDFDYLFAWNGTIRYWLATLTRELDRPKQATMYLESLMHEHYGLFNDPYVEYELAILQDQLGKKAEAIEGYENAATAWRDADPELRPRVEASRRAITRLSGAEE